MTQSNLNLDFKINKVFLVGVVMGKNKYYCRANGKIYNMEDVYILLQKRDYGPNLSLCLIDNHGFEPLDSILFEDVLKFNNWEIPVDYNETLKQMLEYNRKKRCPRCGSTNIQWKKNVLRMV